MIGIYLIKIANKKIIIIDDEYIGQSCIFPKVNYIITTKKQYKKYKISMMPIIKDYKNYEKYILFFEDLIESL